MSENAASAASLAKLTARAIVMVMEGVNCLERLCWVKALKSAGNVVDTAARR
jgi:hypothetical protein